MVIFEINNLTKTFPLDKGSLINRHRKKKVLDNISLDIFQGEVLGLVGESGCGKSTFGRSLLRLQPVDSGSIIYNQTDLLALSEKKFRKYRRNFQMIFQDPVKSLNPKQSVYSCLAEIFKTEKKSSRSQLLQKTVNLLEQVHLSKDLIHRLPQNLSSGQKQRLAIARVLAANPMFIIADEPTSSLDAALKSQFVNLLIQLKKSLGITLLFITHDITLVSFIADRVAVMYDGSIVEVAPTVQIMMNPRHPYTKILLNSTKNLMLDATREKSAFDIKSTVSDDDDTGCGFFSNCGECKLMCKDTAPVLKSLNTQHFIACHCVGN